MIILPRLLGIFFCLFKDDKISGFNKFRTSHVPSATPFAEGIYAITSTGRESHLVYHISHPEIGDVQKELGVHQKGSFIMSVKNPEGPSSSNVGLSNPAEYPEKIQERFRELRWMPLEPQLLDYENTQVLLIGEGMDNFGHAADEMSTDKRDSEKETPVEELEKLEEEVRSRCSLTFYCICS
jgi:hypothetical protein